MDRFQKLLLLLFTAFWAWAAIAPRYRHDWLLENYLVFAFVPVILLTGRYFRLSNLSYSLITLFMCLHVYGAHYTYSEVPLGDVLQDWFGASRNMYDRLVHFAFGVMIAYPMRELLLRVARTRGVWGYLLPVALVVAFSGVYEIIEWLVAVNVDPSAGLAFLGAQGDVWDSQKDMLLAGVGALIAMTMVALIHLRYDSDFVEELRQSLRLDSGDGPLGEVELHRLKERYRNKKS